MDDALCQAAACMRCCQQRLQATPPTTQTFNPLQQLTQNLLVE
jgi:hypothetical protein